MRDLGSRILQCVIRDLLDEPVKHTLRRNEMASVNERERTQAGSFRATASIYGAGAEFRSPPMVGDATPGPSLKTEKGYTNIYVSPISNRPFTAVHRALFARWRGAASRNAGTLNPNLRAPNKTSTPAACVRSLQLRELRLGLRQDGDVRVGVFQYKLWFRSARKRFWHSFAADSNSLNSGVPRSFTSIGSDCKAW